MRKRKNKSQNIWQVVVTIILVICIMALEYINQNTDILNQTNNTEQTAQIISNGNIAFNLSTISVAFR